MSSELYDAVWEFLEAEEAMHTMHGSGDVHNKGGIATAAITPHCAVICNVYEGKFNPETHEFEGRTGLREHHAERDRYEAARAELERLVS